MIVKDSGSNFEQAPLGTHIARCIGLIDVGTHTSDWKGSPIRRRQVIIKWELPMELREDGQPFIASEFYTMSLSDKANLRHALINWRGRDFTPEELRGFELKNILDKGCQITITQSETGKQKVTGVAGLPKGVELAPRHNDLLYFDLDDFDQAVYTELTDGLKKLIDTSEEYQALTGNTEVNEPAMTGTLPPAPAVDDDDIPF